MSITARIKWPLKKWRLIISGLIGQKILQFDWCVVIDKDYIIIKEFLFLSKIWSTYILLKNFSNYVGHFLGRVSPKLPESVNFWI